VRLGKHLPDTANDIFPDSGFKWPAEEAAESANADTSAGIVHDSNSNLLAGSDSVILIKGSKSQRLLHRAQEGHQGQEHTPAPECWRPALAVSCSWSAS